jgi:ATP-dependent RNA helicase DeaD
MSEEYDVHTVAAAALQLVYDQTRPAWLDMEEPQARSHDRDYDRSNSYKSRGGERRGGSGASSKPVLRSGGGGERSGGGGRYDRRDSSSARNESGRYDRDNRDRREERV